MAHETFQAGNLTAVIGDNEAYAGHRTGYNGVHRLTHRTNPKSLFTVTGLNLEHIFDGDQDLRGDVKVRFEPRNFPMTLTKISESEAELHQEETPTFHLESWTRFKLLAPHYVDITFRCKPLQHVFRHGYIGLFWASYIDDPENKSIYFRDDKGWVQLCTQTHDDQSTVLSVDNKIELKFTPDTQETLYKNFSPLRFSDPVYYGLFGTLNTSSCLIVRRGFASPIHRAPAGRHSANEVAWDWQFIIPTYDVLREYGYRARVVYRQRCSRAEVLNEFRTLRAALTKEPR
jgi:hypothetical protein